jgi:creatinine amidohydrolase/Fe(II)-dependent formamide hydrolase-like protein
MLAARPGLVNMKEAVNQDDYSTFFEYRMDRYSKSGVVGRETTQPTTEFGERIFAMVVDNLSHMIEAALHEHVSTNKRHADTVHN